MKVLMVDRAGAASIWYLMDRIAERVWSEGGEVASCIYQDGRSGPNVATPGRAFRITSPVVSRGWLRGGANLVSFARSFTEVLGHFRPDLVHVNFCVPGTAASLVARSRRTIKVVSTCHEMPGSLAPALRLMARLQWLASDRRFAVSSTVAREMGRAEVLANGVDLAELARLRAKAGSPSRPYIACAGRLVGVKGQHLLVRATAKLVGMGFDLDLVLIGDGPERTSLELATRRLQLADRVQITGWLSRERALQTMASAALVVVPSRSGQEGFCLVILEALGLARPVVASRIALFEEFVEPDWDVTFFAPDNPDDLAVSIARRLERSSCSAPANLGAYASERMAASYVAAYRELLGCR